MNTGRCISAAKAKCVNSSPGVNQISYNGELARAKGQTMHYVTERAVFELRPEGPVLTEIAPGIDLERDILAHMDFHPAIAADLQVMDSRLFAPPPCGLAGTSVPEFIL
ncbi:hypothetical protein LNQ03_30710 [Klebsiella pneumoniae subsp. pneumoniae]|nr:hypothetical protein [Klebsiella pneumoniae subsp. pneumoniae]